MATCGRDTANLSHCGVDQQSSSRLLSDHSWLRFTPERMLARLGCCWIRALICHQTLHEGVEHATGRTAAHVRECHALLVAVQMLAIILTISS
jgi:hypothetical protein